MGRISVAERDKRVVAVSKMLAQGWTKGDIKRAIKAEYGVTPRTVEDYISLAIARAEEDVAGTPKEKKAEALSGYLDQLRRAIAEDNLHVELRIRERIDRILGNEEPIQVETTNETSLTVEDRLEKLSGRRREIVRALQAVGDEAGEDFVDSLSRFPAAKSGPKSEEVQDHE